MTAVVVRYRVKAGRAEENAQLVRAVYAELAQRRPPGFHYLTSVLDDGETFVHVAVIADGHSAPLPELATFRTFVGDIDERCVEPPSTTRLTKLVGSYGWDDESETTPKSLGDGGDEGGPER